MTYWQDYYQRSKEKRREASAHSYRLHGHNPEVVQRFNLTLGARYSRLKHRAKTGGTHSGPPVRCTLTIEQYAQLLTLPCHYCGGPLPATGSGLDRKDPFGDYSPENAVPCCKPCNSSKQRCAYEAFVARV